jgi:hypothetical protein
MDISKLSRDQLLNLKKIAPLVQALVDGDESVIERADYKGLNLSELQEGLELLLNNPRISDNSKNILLKDSYKLIYRDKPAYMEEFLSPKFLGGTYESLYPYAFRILKDYFNPDYPFRNLILASSIGSGKSLISILANLYVAYHLWLMRNPKHYLGIAPANPLAQILISFSLDKAKELLVEPFIAILESTALFERCKTLDSMHKKQKEYGNNKICWTTASATSVFTFSNGTNIKIASSATRLLGISIIMGMVSELSFFQDRGFSQNYIWQIITDLKGRIQNRFPNNYWARSIIDSSPNDMDGVIDKYIFGGEASHDPTNMIITSSEWRLQPWKYHDGNYNEYKLIDEPDWYKYEWVYKNEKHKNLNNTFAVYKGNGNKPPKILTDEEVSSYDATDVLQVPKMREQLFEDNLIKSLKDYGGIPAGLEDKLIQNKEKLEEVFVPSLKNIYTNIFASSLEKPEGLIWNLIKDQFFIEYKKGVYQFWRNPLSERFVSIDQSVSGDTASISMSHSELSIDDGSIIYVTDFTIPIVPNKKRINLDAIKFFVRDLRDIGHLNIAHVSYDKFESEASMQWLIREEFEVERLSVDISMAPYLSYINLINTGLYKCGYNIFMKNNLKSLGIFETRGGKNKEGRKKVDHLKGKIVDKDNGKWDTSLMGYWAKDASDSACASVELCKKYSGLPTYIWDNTLMSKSEGSQAVSNQSNLTSILEKLGFKKI